MEGGTRCGTQAGERLGRTTPAKALLPCGSRTPGKEVLPERTSAVASCLLVGCSFSPLRGRRTMEGHAEEYAGALAEKHAGTHMGHVRDI